MTTGVPDAATFWEGVFGDPHPVEIEVGSGTGTFLLHAAKTNPGRNFFGMEHAQARAVMAKQRLLRNQASNARIIAADAACVLRHLVPSASVAAIHVYFPDPWWKRKHHRRRLFTNEFAASLARTLVPGGYVHTATDVEEVFALIRKTLVESRCFIEDAETVPQRPPTVFERKGLARGATIWEMSFRSLAPCSSRQ